MHLGIRIRADTIVHLLARTAAVTMRRRRVYYTTVYRHARVVRRKRNNNICTPTKHSTRTTRCEIHSSRLSHSERKRSHIQHKGLSCSTFERLGVLTRAQYKPFCLLFFRIINLVECPLSFIIVFPCYRCSKHQRNIYTYILYNYKA